ncbi:hypothetical protein F4778DRAFT_403539 [Xylariomycetidae sp. FL2044]|nr:hypothetical protein F4778DRAFT_403539 [Xylariomycetidae sp. FL2044]
MLTVRSLFLTGLACGAAVEAAPQSRQQAQTAQEQAAQIPGGVSQATDGSMILDTEADVNGLTLRFKISGPADQFTADSGIEGATQEAGAAGTLGLNVLLHGDGGQSFFDFPNQGVQQNTAGVAVLAPDENLFWGGGSGLDRTDGVAHAQAVNDLVLDVLPQVMAFNASQVSFTGVSGGSLLLSGFFMPAHLPNFAPADAGQIDSQSTAVLLNCGGLEPQVDVADAGAVGRTRIHFQSTQQELELLQPAIPAAVAAYEKIASVDAGLGDEFTALMQTVDNTPDGGHCEFDEQDFVSGVQLMADSFAAVVQDGDGVLAGTNLNVLNPVVGNEDLQFSGAS